MSQKGIPHVKYGKGKKPTLYEDGDENSLEAENLGINVLTQMKLLLS